MAEFSLPKNSKVQVGKDFPYKGKSENKKVFNIYRWSPDDDDNPRIDTYTIDMDECGPMGFGCINKNKR